MGRLARVVLLGVSFLASALLLQACGANDDPFTVTITNNTDHTVVDDSFFLPKPGTTVSGDPVLLKPGHSFGETEFANEGVDPDRITTPSGKTLGCFPFQFSENAPTPLVVKVSQMVPCKRWVPESNLPRDWPNPNY